MSNSCKVVPNAKNGKPSILFEELRAKTKNRELSKTIWAFTQTELFQSEFGDMPKDENGEVTYEAIADILQLDRIMDQSMKDSNLAIDQGIMKKNGEAVQFDLASVALGKAKEYNAKSAGKIGIVEERTGKYVVSVQDKGIESVTRGQRQEGLNALNSSLIDLLHKAGFDVKFADNTSYAGIFNPLLARENAGLLKTVIEVANDERGTEALPEEVSHLILAGLSEDVLKKRLDAVFTHDVVRRVLGDRYSEYYNRYKNGRTPVEERMRDEAEGQVLAAMLKGDTEFFEGIRTRTEAEIEAERNKSLLSRLWSKAKQMFRKISKTDIDSLLTRIQEVSSPIVDIINDESVLDRLDHDAIMNHEHLFDLNDRVNEAIRVVNDGIQQLEKRRDILLHSYAVEEDARPITQAIEKAQKELDVQNYYSACYAIMKEIGEEVQELVLEANNMGHIYKPANDLELIAANAGIIDRISNVVNGYMPYLATLKTLPAAVKAGEIELTESGAQRISEMATKYWDSLDALKVEMKRLRFNVLRQLISMYYGINGEKPENFKETESFKWQSVDTLLREAETDISFWDSNLFSAGRSRNALLNVVHHIVKSQMDKRNNIINSYCIRMQFADAKLKAAGHDNKFIYKLDENGKPTGYYVAPVDMLKFERAREDYRIEVDQMDDLTPDERRDLIHKWENENMVEVEVGEPVGPNGERRTELMPNPEKYKDESFQKGWDDAQKEYYNEVLRIKAEMDSQLPMPMQSLYRAPQVRKSVTQMFDKDGPGALRTLISNWKKKFKVTTENAEYGEYEVVQTDFRNKKIKRVPIYFTRIMENREDLSTDGTHAMFNYISMAVNYSEMGKLANVMRLLQEHVSDEDSYTVKQVSGGKVIKDIIHGVTGTWSRDYTEGGSGTQIAKALTSFIDRTVFNMTKDPLPKVKISDTKSIDLEAMTNVFMYITSVSRMGINPLSAITNVSQGESQMLTEAIAKRFFNMKDLTWSKAEYFKLLPAYLGSFNSANRKDKMYLLINQFNAMEDFFHDMMDRDFNKSSLKRVMGRGNVYFLNTMGEHFLHVSGMLSILHHEKVRLVHQNKTVSLYEAIRPVEDENGVHLELVDDIEFVNKNRAFLHTVELHGKDIITKDDRDSLFESLTTYINNINAHLHGGYSVTERGNWNRLFVVRAVLQFRQWMFDMYDRLYSKPYYDASLQMKREGAYRTMFRQIKHFFTATVHDMKNMSIKMAIEQNRLTQEERDNARVAWAQSGLVLALGVLALLTKGLPDEDDRAKRLLAYSIKRLQLETGALAIFPNPYGFVQNIFTLVQSPAAGIKTLESLTDLLEIGSMWDEIESGRFEGWSRWEKAAITLTPIYNIQKIIDMENYNYMFNIFN